MTLFFLCFCVPFGKKRFLCCRGVYFQFLLSWLDRKQWEEERTTEVPLHVDLRRSHFFQRNSKKTQNQWGLEKAKVILNQVKTFDPNVWYHFSIFLLGQTETTLNLQRNSTLKTNKKEMKIFIFKMARQGIPPSALLLTSRVRYVQSPFPFSQTSQ